MKFLSEEFNEENFKQWNKQYNWGIFSECGSGKTTILLDHYVPYAEREGKTVLYLYNRKSLGEQLKNKYERKYKNLKFMSYQSLNDMIISKSINQYIPIEYDVLILDESHFFVMDSVFSFETMYSWNYINECDSIKIFLTATPEPLKAIQYLMTRPLKVLRDIDPLNNNIEKILLTTDDDVIKQQEKEYLKANYNVIEWQNDVEKVKQSKESFSQLGYKSVAIISEYHKRYEEITDIDVKSHLEHEYKDSEGKLTTNMNFDFLACTKAIDNGISMYSEKNTLVSYPCNTDFVTLEQSRSRCREMKGNKTTMLIKVPNRKHVYAKINYFEDELSWLKNHELWYRNHGVDKQPSYVYFEVDEYNNAKLKINNMKLAYIELQLKDLKYMYENFETLTQGYIDILSEMYPTKPIEVLNRTFAINIDEVLNPYIEDKSEVILSKEQKEQLCLEVKKYKLDKHNPSQTPRLKKIRELVEKQSKKYILTTTRKYDSEGKKVTYWVIKQKENELKIAV
ncbi:DEAD/DEAH box helicase family protein [Rummeliibacillus pycnus]|uniref:DEAD/DEAH box helicase family protein n=1 Tax=Rummeliibacillus pycnus TaxID=101070 RepID=UPI000C9B3A8B|nr:DEAD/DEAH box helicase family protein [Rummeliibacillus pycnus]